jgi:hypothetical protein
MKTYCYNSWWREIVILKRTAVGELCVVSWIRRLVAGLPLRLPCFGVSSCGICGGQSGTGTDFLQIFRFLVPIHIPSSPHSLIILSSAQYSFDTDSVVGWGTMLISRKVAGSISDEVIGFFSWPNPSSRTVALVSTQPLTEMSTRNLLGAKGRPARRTDSLTAICEPIV